MKLHIKKRISSLRKIYGRKKKKTTATDLRLSLFPFFSFFSSGMTLSRSWWVVVRAHVQDFPFSWRRLSRSRSVFRRARIQAFEQKNLHTCIGLLGPCLETLLRNWHACLDSSACVLQQQRWKNSKHVFCLSLSGRLGACDLWS